jgi:hypothetical protein
MKKIDVVLVAGRFVGKTLTGECIESEASEKYQQLDMLLLLSTEMQNGPLSPRPGSVDARKRWGG